MLAKSGPVDSPVESVAEGKAEVQSGFGIVRLELAVGSVVEAKMEVQSESGTVHSDPAVGSVVGTKMEAQSGSGTAYSDPAVGSVVGAKMEAQPESGSAHYDPAVGSVAVENEDNPDIVGRLDRIAVGAKTGSQRTAPTKVLFATLKPCFFLVTDHLDSVILHSSSFHEQALVENFASHP